MIKEVKEKKEFLKRSEIRTMQKDIKRLREQEAQKEKERISSLKHEIEKQKEEKKIPELNQSSLDTLIPKKFKKASSFEKILIRIMVVIIIILIGGFFYWILTNEEEVIEKKEEQTEEKKEEQAEEKKEIIIPLSLIDVDQEEIIEIENIEEIPNLLAEILKKEFEENQFTRIIMKDKKEAIGLKGFFESFDSQIPEEFLEKTENDFTLFIYSSNKINQLGLITKIKTEQEQTLTTLLKEWELTIEQDLLSLFTFLGNKEPARYSLFKEAYYNKIPIRYISFNSSNFGICWSILDEYFLFTSSGKSIIELINKF